MIIDGNLKEKKAMENSFHRGDRKEGLRLQETICGSFFVRNTSKKTIVLAKKLVDTTEIVKDVLQYIELIKNMCQIRMRPLINNKK